MSAVLVKMGEWLLGAEIFQCTVICSQCFLIPQKRVYLTLNLWKDCLKIGRLS